MKRGAIISGTGHAGFVALVIFGLPDQAHETLPAPAAVSEVSIISLEDFQAATSDAPDPVETVATAMLAPAETPDVPLPAPSVDPDQPRLAETQVPDPPDVETAPDLSALEPPSPQIEPAPEIAEPVLDAPEGFDTPLLNAPASEGSVNSTTTAMLAPTTPNLAPRIDSSPAPAPPVEAETAPEVREEVANEPEPSPEPVPESPEEQTAQAPKESTSEITPEAELQERPTSVRAASLPKGRPKTRPNEEPTQEPQTREERLIAAIRAANDAKEASDAKPEAPATPAATRLGQDFTSSQREAVGVAIAAKWNKALIEGKDNYERLVVTVRVRLRADGMVMGDVEPIDPRQPSGDFDVAYRAARRAVLRSLPLPLPQDKFRDGDYLEIRFDPGRSAISLQ